MIDLSTTLSNDLGEVIECIDERQYDDKGEEFNLFQEDNEDDEIILDGKRIKRNESSDITVQKIFEVKDTNNISKENINTSNSDKIITADKAETNIQDQKVKTYGMTTPIDGETFSIKRGYQFRPSTIKKLNELKANSDNINIYFNEIIDAAICYYYAAVFKNRLC